MHFWAWQEPVDRRLYCISVRGTKLCHEMANRTAGRFQSVHKSNWWLVQWGERKMEVMFLWNFSRSPNMSVRIPIFRLITLAESKSRPTHSIDLWDLQPLDITRKWFGQKQPKSDVDSSNMRRMGNFIRLWYAIMALVAITTWIMWEVPFTWRVCPDPIASTTMMDSAWNLLIWLVIVDVFFKKLYSLNLKGIVYCGQFEENSIFYLVYYPRKSVKSTPGRLLAKPSPNIT